MTKRVPSKLRDVTCALCGAGFQTRHSQGKYCSPECVRIGERKSWNKYTKLNTEARHTYSHSYYAMNTERIINRTKHYTKTPAGKRAIKICSRRQKIKFPEKIAARAAVNLAVHQGTLVKRPCEHCGAKRVHGHHTDYSRPLDVMWLCQKCHTNEHKRLKAIANNQPEKVTA